MTEQQLTALGWKFVREYQHDEYLTRVYRLGKADIEFTYEGTELVSRELSINAFEYAKTNFNQVILLTAFINTLEGK